MMMNPDSAKQPFTIGSRVFHRRIRPRGGPEHDARYGTILALPLSGPHGPIGLCTVLSDDGELHGIALDALELCADCEPEDGFKIAVQRLHEKREGLFHDMLCTVAASRRINLRDPAARAALEEEVRRMSGSWADADSAALRRKEFLENPELRGRFVAAVTKYLEAADLIKELGGELIGGDSS